MNLFCDRLKAWRLAHKLTQAQMAEKCGWSQTVVSLYENGTQLPGYKNLRELCVATATSADFFLGFVPTMDPL